jgi:serine/threonine protein kinase/WD40 repeat protein
VNTLSRQSEVLLPLDQRLETNSLDAPRLLELLRQLAHQLTALHEQGRWHGNLTTAAVVMSESGQARLLEANTEATLAGDLCPPELREQQPLTLPTNLAAAAAALASQDQTLDPRRIDVYQLAALIVTAATRGTLDDYLCRPLVSAKVPPALRPILDRALGFSEAQRLANCSELLEELAAADREDRPLPGRDTPSLGISLHSGDTDVARQQRRELDHADDSLPFQRLGQYEIVARLGSGGMGDVYQGYDADLDRYVAIKVLPAELARQEDFVTRFRIEAAAAAKVEHPNIVPIYTIGADQGHHFFAMQLVVGETLGQLLARQRQPPLETTLAIVEQVVSGLAAAHRRHLVHRDIKPGNILLTENGRALVADFGLAKSVAADTRMTATGVIMGTVDYLSPEQGRGKPVDGRSDLYSIGVLLYQMIAGRLPFAAESPTAMIFQHAYEPPPPLALAAPDVPPPLAALVHRLLAKSPDERYATCEELLDDLRAIAAGKPPRHLQSAGIRQRTAIITAPKFDDEPATVEAAETPSSAWSWNELYQRGMLWLGRKAPEVVRRWQNTQQQVDGAVFEYEQRCRSLDRLVSEAEDVQRLLAEQLQGYQEAAAAAQHRAAEATDSDAKDLADSERLEHEAAAAQLQPQIAQQRDEMETMQLARAQARAKLARIKGQRDALNARLQVAHARYGLATIRPRRRVSRRAVVALITASILVVAALGVWQLSGPRSQLSGPQDSQGATPAAVANDVTEGLIHRWTFDETSGDLASDDVGGARATLAGWTPNEPKWVEGRFGGALQFDGTDNRCITNRPIPLKQYTVSFWIKRNGDGGINPRIIALGDGEHAITFDRRLGHGIIIATAAGCPFDPTPPPLNTWVHYVIVVDTVAGKGVIYRDGQQAASGSIGRGSTAGNWVFGHNNDAANHKDTFAGSLDDVRVYHRLLSAEEARNIANFGKLPVDSNSAADTSGNATGVRSDATKQWLGLPFRPTVAICAQENDHIVWVVMGREDGGLVPIGAQNGTFTLDKGPLVPHTAHSQRVSALAWNSQSRRLASASDDGEILVWHLLTNFKIVRRLRQNPNVRSLIFSPDGNQLLASSVGESVYWDVNSGNELDRHNMLLHVKDLDNASSRVWLPEELGRAGGLKIKERVDYAVIHALFAGNGQAAGIGKSAQSFKNQSIFVWNTQDGQLVRSFGERVECAAFGFGGRALVGDSLGGLTLWNTSTGEKIQAIGQLEGPIDYVGLSENGELGIALQDKTLRLFPLPPEKIPGIVRRIRAKDGITSLALAPDKFEAVSAGLTAVDRWRSLDRPSTIYPEAEKEAGPVSTAVYSSDGARLLIARPTPDREGQGPITLRDGNSATLRRYAGHAGGTNAAYFARNDAQIISGGNDNHVRVWETSTENELRSFDTQGVVRFLAVTRDGARCVVVSDDVDPKIWDVVNKVQLGVLKGHSLKPQALAIARNANIVVTASSDRTARVWNLDTRENIATFEHPSAVSAVSIAARGQWVVTGCGDGGLRFWRIGEKSPAKVIYPHQGRITALALAPDNRTVLSAGEDHFLSLCEALPD